MDRFKFIGDNLSHLHGRARLEKAVREWFDDRGFLEVTTPVILPHSSLEENIEPLTVTMNTANRVDPMIYDRRQGFLRVSPELSLKKILVEIPKIFELGPCFRDLERSDSPQHLHEFTLLEWYHTGITLHQLIREFMDLVSHLAKLQSPQSGITYDNREYHLEVDNWNILTVAEAFRRHAGIDFDRWNSWEDIFPVVRERGFDPATLDDAFYWLFLNEVEPHIRSGPTIIYEYPIFQASFSQGVRRPSPDNPQRLEGLEYGLRFEAYLGGMEICNGFQELVDPAEQKRRWQNYLEKQEGDLTQDEEFLTALKKLQDKGTPISGIAVGWERLLMFLFGSKDIREIQPLS